MILVTGANGQVGRAIIKALLSKGEQIRAFVFRNEHVQEIKKLGEMDVAVGDMLNQEDLDRAFAGVNRVYHPYNAPTYQPLGRWDGIFHYIPPSF